MLRRSCAVAMVAALALVFAAVPVAAQGEIRRLRVEDIDSSGYPTVTMTVTAPNELAGADDFSVVEDGTQRDFEITAVPNDSLEVLLLVDTSGSMAGDPIAAARASAKSFVERMPDGVSLAVMGFGSEPRLLSAFSNDRQQALTAVDQLETTGETALYDGLVAAVAEFPEGPGTSRRTVVLLSDGGDTVSEQSVERAIIALLEGEVRLDAIELQSPENDSGALQRLASAVNGEVVQAEDVTALEGIYEQVASDLVNQYTLSYESEGSGLTELQVVLEAGDVRAQSTQTIRLPAAPVEPVTRPRPEVVTPATVIATPTLREGVVLDPGLFGSAVGLWIGLASVFVALAALLYAIVVYRQPIRRELRSRAQAAMSGTSTLSSMTDKVTAVVEKSLDRRGRRSRLNTSLERAGIALRPGEYLLIVGSLMLLGLAGGAAFSGWTLGLVLMAAVPVVAHGVVARSAAKRAAAFAEQLPDTLQLLAGSLRAGYGLMQAVDAVAQEALWPTSDEMRRLIVETRLGRDVGEGLEAMAERLANEDFQWVVQAIAIHRDVGGNLAELLETVAGTIRDREQVRRQIKALSAEGRISAVILIGLPFMLALAMLVVNPGYLAELINSGVGRIMLLVGATLMGVGTIWLRKIIRLVF